MKARAFYELVKLMRDAQRHCEDKSCDDVWKTKRKEYEQRIDNEITRVERILADRNRRRKEEKIISEEEVEKKIKEIVEVFNSKGFGLERVK